MIGTAEAGRRLGITPNRVRALIKAGRIPAKKLGRDYFMEEVDLKLVKNRKPGRPKKAAKKTKAARLL
jgi:excisionase family DNA binding protein